jgi:hypothetical protein
MYISTVALPVKNLPGGGEERKTGRAFGLVQIVVACLLRYSPEPLVHAAFEIRTHAHTASIDLGTLNAVSRIYISREALSVKNLLCLG